MELFTTALRNILLERELKRVAVVGGYPSDPEVQVLIDQCQSVSIEYYGLEPFRDSKFLDLNNTAPRTLEMEYDLVICSQVIEHIWNVENFFTLLTKLTSIDGYLWLGCPSSNICHGSPDFFATGYNAEFLTLNLNHRGWKVIEKTTFGTVRVYVATHLYGTWLSKDEMFHPLWKYKIQPGTLKGQLWKLFRDIPKRIHLSVLNSKISENPRWATESVVLARRQSLDY